MCTEKWYKLWRNSGATFLATLERIKMLLQCFQQAGWSLQLMAENYNFRHHYSMHECNQQIKQIKIIITSIRWGVQIPLGEGAILG